MTAEQTPDEQPTVEAHRGSHYWSNGTEHLDWQEVWCFRCRHDHDMTHGPDTGPGCDIMLRAVVGEPLPEIIEAGYTVVFADEDGDLHEHEVPNVFNSIPAAAFCTRWEPCEEACRRHMNGAVIVELRKGAERWPK